MAYKMLLFAAFGMARIVRTDADGECMSNKDLNAPCTILPSEAPGTCSRRQVGSKCKQDKECPRINYYNEGWKRPFKCKYTFVCADISGLEEIHNKKTWDCQYLEPDCYSNANLGDPCTMSSGNPGTCRRREDASTCEPSVWHRGCPRWTECNYTFVCEDNVSKSEDIHAAEQSDCKLLESEGHCEGNADVDAPCTILPSGTQGICSRSDKTRDRCFGGSFSNRNCKGERTKCAYNFVCADNDSGLKEVHMADWYACVDL